MKYLIRLLSTMIILMVITLQSCSKEDNDNEPDLSPTSTTSSKKPTVTKPSFDMFMSTSDKASFSIRVRFKTGGDEEKNLKATVRWKAYSSKPSKTPSKNDLTTVESMRQYGSATYHKTGSKKGMTESIVFDKGHAGYGGSYIYYYVECSNSKGTANSGVTYMVTRR